MFKQLSNLASLMKQAQQMGGKMQEVQDKLKSQRVTGTAGAGMVSVEVNGLGEVLRVSIEPDLVAKGDREMIEDLIPAAVNQAVTKSKQLHIEAMEALTQGLDLPSLNDVLSQITGNLGDEVE
jgi:DNA-binding YbaB/EbfC family protein